MIALGFLFNGGNSYLRNSWNVLDFLIVIFALFSQGLDANISFIKVLRVARILRPLRLIQRAQGLKIAIQSLFKALPDIFRLQVVVFFVMFMISILLTTLLSGKLSHCDLSLTTLTEPQAAAHVSNMWDCLNYGGEWVTPSLNFDNTRNGMMSLFILQSREGWITLMWTAVDSVGVYRQPRVDQNTFYILVFMVLVILLCLLFVNMFVGIVIDTYNNQKEYISLNSMLEPAERSWI